MTCYSIEPKNKKGYGFLFFTKNVDKNIGKKLSKILSSK